MGLTPHPLTLRGEDATIPAEIPIDGRENTLPTNTDLDYQ